MVQSDENRETGAMVPLSGLPHALKAKKQATTLFTAVIRTANLM